MLVCYIWYQNYVDSFFNTVLLQQRERAAAASLLINHSDAA